MAKKKNTITGVTLLFSDKEKIQGALLKFGNDYVFYLLKGHKREVSLKTAKGWLAAAKKATKKVTKKDKNV